MNQAAGSGVRGARGAGLVLAVVCAALPPAAALAQPEPVAVLPRSSVVMGGGPHLERVGVSRASTPDIVTAVHEDRAGFLWMGAWGGLYRYDSAEFVAFRHDANDPRTVSDNAIRTIYQDREGRLWVGTNTGGLNLFDAASGGFRTWRHDGGRPDSLSHDSIYAILQDRDGRLWVGTQRGLNRFDPRAGTFERFMAGTPPAAPGNDYVHALHLDVQGVLWVATVGGGLQRRDPRTGAFTAFRHDANDTSSINSDDVFSIVEDAGGLWVGTSRGLARLARGSDRFQRFASDPQGLTGPPSDILPALARTPDGTIWMATWGGGLGVLNPVTRQFSVHHYQEEAAGPREENVTSVFAGRGDTVWIGTWGNGLNRLHRSAPPFRTLEYPSRGSRPVTRDTGAVLEDRSGRLWVGVLGLLHRAGDGEALRVLDPGGGIENDTVLSLLEDRTGRVWAGAMSNLFVIEGGRVTRRFTHDPAKRAGIGHGYVRALCEDQTGTIWVGTGNGGLQRLRPDGSTFDHYLPVAGDPGSLSDAYVTAIVEDRAGRLWVGTRSGGLNLVERETGRARRFLPGPPENGGLGHQYVSTILEDSSGRLWVGTAGGGVHRLVTDAAGRPERFVRLDERDGLADNSVVALAEDADGSLWIATRNGLSRHDPDRRLTVSYGPSDGLPTNAFSANAAIRGRTHLFFGTARGTVALPIGTPFPRPEASPIVFTSVKGGGHAPVAAPWDLDRIELPYGQPLAVEYSLLDYGGTRSQSYSYRLDAGSGDWMDAGTQRGLTLTALRPGQYTLQVRGRNLRGVWSETRPLAVTVVPPFWMTTWFRVASVLAVVVLIGAWHRVRTSALERRNQELQALQTARLQALAAAQSSNDALQRAYHELQLLTRRLEAAKEDERKHIARELHDEMGQALTAAKISVQLLERDTGDPVQQRRLTELVILIDRMIRHVRQLSIDLRPPLLDEVGLGLALQGYLNGVSRHTGLAITVRAEPPAEPLPPELEITAFRLAQEAVTNVVRHAAATKADVVVRTSGGHLVVEVTDDGRGFDTANTLARASSGAHAGLLGLMERTRSFGGQTIIESAPGRGTRVVASIPLAPAITPEAPHARAAGR
jgi:signal transduction histidine kinase/ligand-binding sensor domain-containing protein